MGFFSSVSFSFWINLNVYIFIFMSKPYSGWTFFGGCSRMGGTKEAHLPKICHADHTMMKLGIVIPYLKKTQKYMSHVTHPLSCADISNFSFEISKFCYIRKYRYRLYFGTLFLTLLIFFYSS